MNPDNSSLATPAEVAALLRTTAAALAQMRYRGEGPTFRKLGRRVLYRWDDVTAWVDARAATTTGPTT
ncbi:helix-turn-helix transcriptional regulator [Nocardia tengchongensis]|uniref:helix-turn-helix transcriptional regulator n=1 Tax=Nocardia tengchongensis TaxID=2055889 RepID=UPI00364E67FC